MYIKRKISTKNIDKFLRPHSTDEKVLVIHSEDIDWQGFFPNAYTVTKRRHVPADLHVDKYYRELSGVEDESYSTIICTGLLEHLPEPHLFQEELLRIMKPGGKLLLQASGAFSIHEGPDDFYHFTHFSFEKIFHNWERKLITGSCMPYETIAILLQRILYQADVGFLTKIMTVILYNIIPLFDKRVYTQYSKVGRSEKNIIDSMLPSNMQIICYKPNNSQ